MIRQAKDRDIRALIDIENRAFRTDRFTPRSFRYLLSEANAVTLVDEDKSRRIRGYTMVLFHDGTSLARLYSLAVDPRDQGKGLGRALLRASFETAVKHGAAYMRLEVREDDKQTQALYQSEGFRPFGTHPQYYEDEVSAIRMEKKLGPARDPRLARVPYYPQSLDFTCGPAAMLMAMHALDSRVKVDRTAELRLWRESTTIFMTAGHGGCSPYGLALAAHRRGFAVDLFVSSRGVLFVDSVRSEIKKKVVQLVQQDFIAELRSTPVKLAYHPLSLAAMREAFDDGGIPIVLVSIWRLTREKQPHWVVVTGFDDNFVYVHDPNVDEADNETPLDRMQIPIPLKDFARMARYGRSQQKAALIVRRSGGRRGAHHTVRRR